MKTKTLLFTTGCLLLSFLFSSAQDSAIPVHKKKPARLETVGDKYLPNEFNDKKTSPSYSGGSLRNTNIFTQQVNVNAGGENILGDAGNEPNIAFNPNNENEIVIGWRQFDNVSSNFRQAGWSYTSDGGLTWTFPGVIEPGIFRSDPVLDYDANGKFYYNSLTLDNFGNFTCKVFKSINGGSSWDGGTDAGGGDKQSMTIDRTTGEGAGNIYSTWTYAYSSCLPGFFTRSTDGGNSYENCTEVDGDPFWGTMSVGINGELYIAGSDTFGNIVVTKSLNAQSPDSIVSWSPPVSVSLDGFLGYGATVNPGGLLGQINVDVDRSNGLSQGNIYVLAPIVRTGIYDPGDIMFARSTDGGTTWNSPIRINDDQSEINTQWFGTMSVAPNGRIDVIWLDTRDALYADFSALYYSYSLDGGNTWSVNEKLSDSFDPHIGYPNQDKMGDYFDMVSDSSGAHLAWANTLNGEQDVYYSHIIPPTITAVNQNTEINFSVFPNPTSGAFVCITDGGQSQIEICNELGQKIFSTASFNARTEIDISSQPTGIYFMKVVDQKGNQVQRKIIKD